MTSRTLVITLSTVLPVGGVLICSVVACICICYKRRRGALFNRGITPIGDDEIATWKVNRGSVDKDDPRGKHVQRASNDSNASSIYGHHKKSSSLIKYQSPGRPSFDMTSPASPRSFVARKLSLDSPQIPQSAVLARAPNAREGLTDETVPGDQPYIQTPRRHLSKRNRAPQSAATGSVHRARGSQSSSTKSFGETLTRESTEMSPRPSYGRHSFETRPRNYSVSAAPPRISLGDRRISHENSSDGEHMLTPLSPRPCHPGDIGRAIG